MISPAHYDGDVSSHRKPASQLAGDSQQPGVHWNQLRWVQDPTPTRCETALCFHDYNRHTTSQNFHFLSPLIKAIATSSCVPISGNSCNQLHPALCYSFLHKTSTFVLFILIFKIFFTGNNFDCRFSCLLVTLVMLFQFHTIPPKVELAFV